MIESASNTSRRRRQVWLARMRQRDACWVGEVTLKGSRIVSEPAPCGSTNNVTAVHIYKTLNNVQQITSSGLRRNRATIYIQETVNKWLGFL